MTIQRIGNTTRVTVVTSDMPAPDRSISVQAVAAHRRGRDIDMVFAQMPPGGGKATAALIVTACSAHLRQALYEANPDFIAAVRDLSGDPAPSASSFPIPERTAYERATVSAFFATENEGEIRFFHIAVAELQKTSSRGTIPQVTPVVSVYMSVEDLHRLLTQLDALLAHQETKS